MAWRENLQKPQQEDARQLDLVALGHVQLADQRQRQDQEDDVETGVDEAQGRIVGIDVDAVVRRPSKLGPDRDALEDNGEYARNGKGGREPADCPQDSGERWGRKKAAVEK